MTFFTEKQTETYLEEEIRDIKMPDGSLRPYRNFKVWWEAYDYLIWTTEFIPQKLVEYALREKAASGKSFDQSLEDVVAFLDNRIRPTRNA